MENVFIIKAKLGLLCPILLNNDVPFVYTFE